jgi:hypothetical protein
MSDRAGAAARESLIKRHPREGEDACCLIWLDSRVRGNDDFRTLRSKVHTAACRAVRS